MRFAQAASRVWGCDMDFANPERTAAAGIAAFQNFLASIGMPATLGELGAKEEDIEKLARRACFGDGRNGHFGGFVDLYEQDVIQIYKMML